MPIQINEVIIRTVVDGSPAGTPAVSTAPAVSRDEDDTLEKLIEIIKEKNER